MRTSIFRRLAAALVAVAAGVSLLALSSTPASAATSCHSTSSDGGATICFDPAGEHLYVCDTAADGHHPAVWYQGSDDYNLGQHGTADYYGGYGSCGDLNLSMPEDTSIRFYAINREGSTNLSYGPMTGWISADG